MRECGQHVTWYRADVILFFSTTENSYSPSADQRVRVFVLAENAGQKCLFLVKLRVRDLLGIRIESHCIESNRWRNRNRKHQPCCEYRTAVGSVNDIVSLLMAVVTMGSRTIASRSWVAGYAVLRNPVPCHSQVPKKLKDGPPLQWGGWRKFVFEEGTKEATSLFVLFLTCSAMCLVCPIDCRSDGCIEFSATMAADETNYHCSVEDRSCEENCMLPRGSLKNHNRICRNRYWEFWKQNSLYNIIEWLDGLLIDENNDYELFRFVPTFHA